jgi:hypothetical protein
VCVHGFAFSANPGTSFRLAAENEQTMNALAQNISDILDDHDCPTVLRLLVPDVQVIPAHRVLSSLGWLYKHPAWEKDGRVTYVSGYSDPVLPEGERRICSAGAPMDFNDRKVLDLWLAD